MQSFCVCDDWEDIHHHHPSIFKKDSKYGWVISWTDFSTINGRTVKSTYGIKIKYCPLCGRKLNQEVVDAE